MHPRPSNDEIARAKALAQRRRNHRDLLTALVVAVAACQILGTAGKIPWTPGLFLHGGFERLIDYAAAEGFAFAAWLTLGMNIVLCVYWVVLSLATSRLGQDVPPGWNPAREQHWVLPQRRIAYLWPVVLLLASHAVGAAIAATGWWLLAIPFETGGHLGMAYLLYLWLVPEARKALVVVADVGGNGFDSRLYLTTGRFGRGRRWTPIRHDHLRAAVMHAPLRARLLNHADLELAYLDAWNQHEADVMRAAGSPQQIADLVAYLNGQFRDGRPLPYTLPPSYANTPQPPEPPRS